MIEVRKPEWPIYGAWIVLSVLSVPIAFALSLLIMMLVTMFVGDFIYVDGVPHITEDYLSSYSFVPLLGLMTGIAQYVLLRRNLPGMGWWVAATILGWSLILLLMFGLRELMATFWPAEAFYRSLWVMDSAFILLGLSIGTAQWLLLHHRLPRAGWWIVANLAGWGLLALVTAGPFNQNSILLVALVPACATAVALAFLFNQNPPVELQGV